MVIPQFNIRLRGPTSTTKQIEVSERFGGEQGIIIALNNNGYFQCYTLHSWNCSGEDERVWMGGEFSIKIEGVRILSTHINCQKYFQCLYYFDAMLTGMQMGKVYCRPSQNNYLTLTKFIKHKIGTDEYKNKFGKYINDTFYLFVNYKKQMVI
eukprot:293402_1